MTDLGAQLAELRVVATEIRGGGALIALGEGVFVEQGTHPGLVGDLTLVRELFLEYPGLLPVAVELTGQGA